MSGNNTQPAGVDAWRREYEQRPVSDPNACEECGSPDSLPCCDEAHVRLCQRHYEAMVRRMQGDPIRCPLKSEAMRWSPSS